MPTDAQHTFQFQDLNEAKQLAWSHCSDAVRFLVWVMNNEDVDMPDRVTAAAELLAFSLKGVN